jgi:hypothetical protein
MQATAADQPGDIAVVPSAVSELVPGNETGGVMRVPLL